MNIYEKIGRLIKQNKIFNLSENCNTNSKSIDDSTLAQELDNIESFLSDILSPSKLDTKNININNKEFSKTDLEEAQNLIKKCSPDEQSILISILEIQLSLTENENNYVKYEKINDIIIEKNIYWVITCELHKRVHKEKTEFEEYCHCIKGQKEKYILGTVHNFKYESIDSNISKLKYTNKNIEFIAIKSIYISLYNLTCEYIQKYLEITEYNKKNKINEYLIFDYILNDYIYIKDKIKFLNIDFKQSLDNFISNYNIDLSFENLFKDIFFNAIFHNQIIGFLYIQGFIHAENDIKLILKKILDLVRNIKLPLSKNMRKILDIENLIEYKFDLTSKILEQNEHMPICIGVGKCEIKNDEEKGEIVRKKEIIYIRGKIGKKDENDDKLNFCEDFPHLNMEKILMDLDDDSSKAIIKKRIIINKIKRKESKDKESNSDNDTDEEKEKVNNNVTNNNKENKDNNNLKINEKNNSYQNEKTEESKVINNNKVQDDSNNISDVNKNSDKDNMDMDNKSLEEIYEYITKDNKVKNKKKNKRRNKGKLKKKKKQNETNDSSLNNQEDPVVIQFKNDLQNDFIFAGNITKIKPLISENWINSICSN